MPRSAIAVGNGAALATPSAWIGTAAQIAAQIEAEPFRWQGISGERDAVTDCRFHGSGIKSPK
jgi:hypothetical protein